MCLIASNLFLLDHLKNNLKIVPARNNDNRVT